MALSETVRGQLSQLVNSHQVVLFMKGNRQFPQCGFSSRVVQILNGLVPKYETVNVLADPAIREGIKEFSNWPTIPQLYVGGQFIGGCDIVTDMHASGELAKLLGADAPTKVGAPAGAPAIAISDGAAAALKSFEQPGADRLRLDISESYQYDLYFAPQAAGDVEVSSNGVTLRLDGASAARADGLRIDFIGGQGGGFKITSLNEPVRVKSLSAAELKRMFDTQAPLELIDVRTPEERAIASIPSSRLLDAAGEAHLEKLDKNSTVVFHCHHGGRSRRAAQHYLQQGFRNVYNLEGGIDAWSSEVDPSVAKY